MTYYDYFNIFFDRAYAPPGAKFNQFVPQLMLGTAPPTRGAASYTPQWPLTSWHFGAQYFMLRRRRPTTPTRERRAATGALHAVAPGEAVRTTFAPPTARRTLRMAVDGDASRVSTVVAAQPFMGLLNTTSSWREYNATTVGSCWENHGMVDASSYPPSWHEVHAINATAPGAFWSEWETSQGGTCPSAPRASVASAVSMDGTSQSATWDITVDAAARNASFVRTPGGLVREGCIISVENGARVDGVAFSEDCSPPSVSRTEQIYAMNTAAEKPSYWSNFTADRVVPALLSKASGQVVYFWPGFKADEPVMGHPVLQPVLQWPERVALGVAVVVRARRRGDRAGDPRRARRSDHVVHELRRRVGRLDGLRQGSRHGERVEAHHLEEGGSRH